MNRSWTEDLIEEIEAVANSSNPRYYAHEINTLTALSAQILQNIDESVGIRTVEEYTYRTVQVFEAILTNTKAWGELNGVRLAALPQKYT